MQGVVQGLPGLKGVCMQVVHMLSELQTAGSQCFLWVALASSTMTLLSMWVFWLVKQMVGGSQGLERKGLVVWGFCLFFCGCRKLFQGHFHWQHWGC